MKNLITYLRAPRSVAPFPTMAKTQKKAIWAGYLGRHSNSMEISWNIVWRS